ncbi:MAG TPA: GAP family protein [Thermoleophilaceae bacterium]|nr:GAP family protein [Thermoleophilaceae bacterium]
MADGRSAPPDANVGAVLLLSLTAALNPTLLTATSVMLLSSSPKRLLLGYWLGAMLTSITLGLLIVYALEGSGAVDTTKSTLSPLANLVLGAILLVLALVLGQGRDQAVRDRAAARRQGKEPPRWRQTLDRGTARAAFVIGAMLTLPGASYLAGLSRIAKLDYATFPTVLAVVGFNLVMLILLEAPLLALVTRPDRAEAAIDRVKAWVAARGRGVAVKVLTVLGGLLVLRGVLELL